MATIKGPLYSPLVECDACGEEATRSILDVNRCSFCPGPSLTQMLGDFGMFRRIPLPREKGGEMNDTENLEIEKVTSYRAHGELFEDKDAALQHAWDVDRRAIINRWVAKHHFRDMFEADLADILYEHGESLVAALSPKIAKSAAEDAVILADEE